nr:unnamed protein product [Meloidogyne enterolobii]
MAAQAAHFANYYQQQQQQYPYIGGGSINQNTNNIGQMNQYMYNQQQAYQAWQMQAAKFHQQQQQPTAANYAANFPYPDFFNMANGGGGGINNGGIPGSSNTPASAMMMQQQQQQQQVWNNNNFGQIRNNNFSSFQNHQSFYPPHPPQM